MEHDETRVLECNVRIADSSCIEKPGIEVRAGIEAGPLHVTGLFSAEAHKNLLIHLSRGETDILRPFEQPLGPQEGPHEVEAAVESAAVLTAADLPRLAEPPGGGQRGVVRAERDVERRRVCERVLQEVQVRVHGEHVVPCLHQHPHDLYLGAEDVQVVLIVLREEHIVGGELHRHRGVHEHWDSCNVKGLVRAVVQGQEDGVGVAMTL
mmetsp:Transcript_71353/g.125621  ORF Transcript_71353/g.125621 Transcript_71353/m.125621 type:complete len:209 (-) Transcript_71353:204-830(-)